MTDIQLTLLLLTAVGALVAALAAFTASIFTYMAAKVTKKASSGATLLSCLDKYIAIMKDKRKAVDERNAKLAEEFYRELFDLHWSEFHVWREKIIPDQVVQSWLYIRKRNFDVDKITFVDSRGRRKTITYKSQWNKLKSTNYFEINDPFLKFMEKAHAGDISDMKKLRKESKK